MRRWSDDANGGLRNLGTRDGRGVAVDFFGVFEGSTTGAFKWDSPKWCNVVKNQVPIMMRAATGESKKMKAQGVGAVRASISFPPEIYETLENIAKEKKVSLAWVVRDAAERYIAEKWPLFGSQMGK